MSRGSGLARSVKDVLFQFRKYKLGFFGLILILAFVFMALLAPLIAQNDPNASGLADSWAVPVWMTSFSEYKELPPDIVLDADWETWGRLDGSSQGIDIVSSKNLTVTLSGKLDEGTGKQTIEFGHEFEYKFGPPSRFLVNFPLEVDIHSSRATTFRVKLYLVDVDDKRWELFSRSYSSSYSRWVPPLSVDSRNYVLKTKLGFSPYDNPAEEILSEKGTYRIILGVEVSDYSPNAEGKAELVLGHFFFRIPGKAFGLLGADNFGGDLFAQLVYGTRVSLLVGVLSAAISISIGTVVGVIAGFRGGLVDQMLMYFTDTLIFLPIIPLLIALSVFFGKNLYFMIILIASLNWMGLARQSRAFVMSLRDSMFVEAERAIGASEIYIAFRHVIPQLAPLIYVGIIFRVPGAILLEAALSFLGLGDPTIASWGKMLYNARYAGAFARLTWWWLVPPGLCITLLAIAFVFMGHSLDEILNPRLKVRR